MDSACRHIRQLATTLLNTDLVFGDAGITLFLFFMTLWSNTLIIIPLHFANFLQTLTKQFWVKCRCHEKPFFLFSSQAVAKPQYYYGREGGSGNWYYQSAPAVEGGRWYRPAAAESSGWYRPTYTSYESEEGK